MKKTQLLFILIWMVSGQVIFGQQPEFPVKLEGRIMYDFDFLSAGDYSFAGNEFRRVRLDAKGSVAKNLGYKVEFDFAGGAVNFRDVYLKYHLPGSLGSIKAGSFTEPTSLNYMTSSKYITFFERSMSVGTQPFKYNGGLMWENYHWMDGVLGTQLAYTFNGDKKKAFKDTKVGGGNLIARITAGLLKNKEKNQILHLGINYEYRQNDRGIYGFSIRPENHMGDKFKIHVEDGFQNASEIGLELAATYGPLSIQGEYETQTINTDARSFKVPGYYAFVSYFVTGEHRPYKKGSFGRVKPKKPVDKGGYGALEVAVRYSALDYSESLINGADGNIGNVTFGLNWYLHPKARIMYNFTSAVLGEGVDIYDGHNLSGHLLRFQIDF